MLLKTKLILVFSVALIIFGITQVYFKFQDLQTTIYSEIQTRDTANNVIWMKINSQITKNMEFYSQTTESGGTPIWSLRGKRSPIASIKSGNVRRLEKTLQPFFEDLNKRGVIDALAVLDNTNELLLTIGSTEFDKFFNENRIRVCSNKLNTQIINDETLSAVTYAFDVFSNGLPVGCVVYSKNFNWLKNKYREDTSSDIQIDNSQHGGTTIPFSFKELVTTQFTEDIQYVSVTNLDSGNQDDHIQLFSITDMTNFVDQSLSQKYRDLALLTFFLIILSLILALLMSREFSKLNLAILRLQALSKGRLYQDEAYYTDNEVGRIMTAVQQLNHTIGAYSTTRKNIAAQRESYIENLYKSIQDMSSHLPSDLKQNVQTQIRENIGTGTISQDNENIFAEKEDNSIKLVNDVLYEISQEINKQITHQTELTKSYQRFVPTEIVKSLNKTDIRQIELGDQKQHNAYILFTDIRNFTGMSEKLSSAQVFELLNSLLDKAIPTIKKSGGYVDKFIGDAVLAVFDTDIGNPVECAIELLNNLKILNEELVVNYDVNVSIGIGIHYGPVVSGTIGNQSRMEGTVIGDTVNTAARLEALTKKFKTPLVVSEAVIAKMQSENTWRYRDPRRLSSKPLKGKTESVEVFEISDWRPKPEADVVSNSRRLFKNYHEEITAGKVSEQIASEIEKHITRHPWDETAKIVLKLQ
jgi:class 3 adenylate cyclase